MKPTKRQRERMKRISEATLVYFMTNDTFPYINKKTSEHVRIKFGDKELRHMRFFATASHLVSSFFLDKHPELFEIKKRKED